VAEATGPTGKYTVAKSSPFEINPSFSNPDLSPGQDNQVAQRALQGLVSKLLHEGWESVGEGDTWFNRQFRRQVQ
jgi:hypothetical protein